MLQQIALKVHALFTTPVFYIFCCGAIVALFFLGKTFEAEVFLTSLILMSVIVVGLKVITHVPRPVGRIVEEKGYAFPSGHSAASAFLAVMMPYSFASAVNLPSLVVISLGFLLLAVVIVLSRLILKVHTPLQVVAGVLIGALVPLVLII